MRSSFFGDVDTAHLPIAYSEKSFKISAAHLVRLVEQCHYRLSGDIVLFGIRAAKSLSPTGCWLESIEIAETIIDYKNLNCLLGLWNLKSGKIAVFQGSTVPFIQHLIKQQDHPSERLANQLLQGSYHYFVGAHEPDDRPKEEGAFRLTRFIPTPVWRNLGEQGIILDACTPNDHIHAAGSVDTEYKSAGCQVVSGFHNDVLPSGEYQQFRILAGQSALPSELEIHLPYQYLLTHARHLCAIQSGWYEERLLMGSEGSAVRQLQESLIQKNYLVESKIDKGMMDGHSVKAVYEQQKALNIMADGIYQANNI